MENNDSTNKPPQTGGLKLMTVFIGVLALHVLVITGFLGYYMMKGGSTEVDVTNTDKTHRNVKVSPDGSLVSDGQLPDAPSDKAVSAPPAPADTKTTAPVAAAPDTTASTPANDSVSAPVPAAAPSPDVTVTPSSVDVKPAATPAPEVTTQDSSSPAPAGPVVTPPAVADTSSDTAADTEATPAADAANLSGSSYTVKAHDSLARIAHQHHITVAKLKAANSLANDRLKIGQKLTIPSKSVVASSRPLTPDTDAAVPVVKDSHVSPRAKPVVGLTYHESAPSTGAGHHFYTVMKGDTLTRIAHKFRTTPKSIMAMNNITDARKMRIGQKLRIPAQESRSATNSSPSPAPTPAPQPDRIEPRATPSPQLANFIP